MRRPSGAGALRALVIAALGLALVLLGLPRQAPAVSGSDHAWLDRSSNRPPLVRPVQAPVADAARIHPAVRNAVRPAAALSATRPISVIVHLRPVGHRRPPRAALDDRIAETTAHVEHLQQHHARASASVRATLGAAARRGQTVEVRPLWLAGALAVRTTPEVVRALAAHPDVRWIAPDRVVQLERPRAERLTDEAPRGPTWNIDRVRAPAVWERLGYDGSGVTIAVLDTGVDYHHPALRPRYRGYRPDQPLAPNNRQSWWCKAVDGLCGRGVAYPVDGNGHGSHVAGIALGERGVGVAPGARWIAARTCPGDECATSWLIEGMQWLLELPPDARPRVMNASWGHAGLNGLAFKEAVDALVTAGVVVVAATGNGEGAPLAPAAFTSTIGVGALTDDDEVWVKSQHGETMWGERKPELVAPGVGVTSTVPGGGWGRLSGTSMATPHVSGAVALLLEARPELRPAEVEAILTGSSVPIGGRQPSDAAGWGRLDTYAALLSVTDHGVLRGRITREGDDAVVPWARLTVAELDGDPVAEQTVDEDGRYELVLAPGEYLLVASAFGYRPNTLRPVRVPADGQVERDLRLTPDEPMGVLEGTLRDAVTGAPLDGRLRFLDRRVPSRFDITVDEHTGFDQRLPPGSYRLQVERFGFRVLTDSVKIVAGQRTARQYALQPAPRILLVDGDAWLYDGAIGFYRRALDALGYLYHEWAVTDETAGAGAPGGPPTVDELAAYDLVIWAHSTTSPGFVRAANEVSAYLTGGGRLLLAGQDLLCGDAGTDAAEDPCHRRLRRHFYVQDQLYVRVVRDGATERRLIGVGPLAGLELTLNGGDSLDNQDMPDELAVVNPLYSTLVLRYAARDGTPHGGAAALTATCVDGGYRALALGFGLEGVAGADDRAALLGRTIELLTAPAPEHGLRLDAAPKSLIRPPGATADFTLTLRSTGSKPTAFDVRVVDGDWPAELWRAGHIEPLVGPIRLDPCEPRPLVVRVRVPEHAQRGDEGAVTVAVRAREGGAAEEVTLRVGTPAPVLVVDQDFFTDSEERYLDGLRAAGTPYDVFEFGLLDTSAAPPSPELLAGYPAVVWFTGHNFLRPEATLDVDSQRALADYLDAGGRLLFASEDYLYLRGGTPYRGERLFHRDYLGVRDYVDEGGAAHSGTMRGAPGSIYDGLTGCTLPTRPPGQDASDRLVPQPWARAAMRDSFNGAVAVQQARGAFKTMFAAFDVGLLDRACADALLARTVDWFSPLHPSMLSAVPPSRRTARAGDRLPLRLTLRNNGPREVRRARVRWRLPVDLTPAAVPVGWSYDRTARELRWSGDVARGVPHATEITLTLPATLPTGARMASEAVLQGDGFPITRTVGWQVDAPDLHESIKSAVPPANDPPTVGDAVSFAVTVRNTGTRAASPFTVTDTLPAGLALVPRSVQVDSGRVTQDADAGVLVWQATLPAGQPALLSYRARVTTYRGGWLRNRAVIDDGQGQTFIRQAAVFARPLLALPWLGHQVDPDP